MFDVEDGWTSTDDPYASADDYLTVAYGSSLDSQYVFEASSSVDTYCLEIADVTARAGTILMNGDLLPSLGIYQHATYEFGGNDWTLQYDGGTGSTCRFHIWKNKACAEWYASFASYPAGCEPDLVAESLSEGVTDIYTVDGDDVEVTCLSAGLHNYVKCQGPTSSDLQDCIDSSFAGDGGGDSLRLYDACLASDSSSSDTEDICDVSSADSWELAVFAPTTLSDAREEVFLRGIPNATFQLYEYTGCGTGAFDRDLVDTVYLTQFTTKERVCGAGYDLEGRVDGYFPWFGHSTVVNESYVYGSSACELGEVCTSRGPEAIEFDPDENACFREAGATCYDGRRNQDESSADYGGICGSCISNSSARDDVYWLVAREQYPVGFFGTAQPFNATTYCPEGEDATNGVVLFFTVLVLLFVGIIAVVLLAVVFYLLFVAFVAAGLARKLFKKGKKYKGAEE